mmetsp:Transcript_147145/g.256838  ORF Transcript_147145/g.256838 Transcript_147145/m.256838 type:complete len:505 (+) Transcript_147145:78-1592(+)
MGELKGVLTEVIDLVQGYLDSWLMRFLMTTFATVLAVIMVLQYHILGLQFVQEQIRKQYNKLFPEQAFWMQNRKAPVFKKMGSSIMHTIGINLIVFQIYFGYNDVNKKAFVWSLAWILFESFILWSFFNLLHKITKCKLQPLEVQLSANWMEACILPACVCQPLMAWLARHSNGVLTIASCGAEGEYEMLEDGENREQDPIQQIGSVRNIYMDISRPFKLPVLFFLAQIGLITYYAYFLNDDEDTHDVKQVSAIKWSVGVLLTLVASETGKEDGKDEAGADFRYHFWTNLFKRTLLKEGLELDQKPYLRNRLFWFFQVSVHREWRYRRFFDFMVNRFCRTILLGTSAIILCVEPPLDFIKDVMAVYFICNLDDYDEAKNWQDVRESFLDNAVHLPHSGVEFPDAQNRVVQFQLHDDTKTFSCTIREGGRNGRVTDELHNISNLRIANRSVTFSAGGTSVEKVVELGVVVPVRVLNDIENMYRLEKKFKNLMKSLRELDEQLSPH